VRRAFINSLTAQKSYAIYEKGWNRRIDSFLNNIKPVAITGLLLLGGLAYLVINQATALK
jgi:hypothetical protein